MNIPELGFIILRHVRDNTSKKLWYLSYRCVRKLYPENPILIIDDHSNYKFINPELEKTLVNTTIVKSTKIGRGEILPYLYYLEHKIAEKIIFVHDSSFITKKIDVSTIKNFKPLWHFSHGFDKTKSQYILLLKLLNGEKLLNFMKNKDKWYGSTGATTIISYDYLKKINDMYDLKRLEPYIKKRPQRMVFERMIGIILYSLEDKVIKKGEESYFGNRDKYHIGKLDMIENFLSIKNERYNLFTAPKIKNSYNSIFKQDPFPKKRKILKIKVIDEYSKKVSFIYKEDTPNIYINSKYTLESVYYGLGNNMVEITEFFKKYFTEGPCNISNKHHYNFLDIYKLKVGR